MFYRRFFNRSLLMRLYIVVCTFSVLFATHIANAQALPSHTPNAHNDESAHSRDDQTDNNDKSDKSSIHNSKSSISNGENADATPNRSRSSVQYRRAQIDQRRKRTIENREFSDKEKITLLLNAHCDFPTKEDLLQTSVNAEAHLLEIIEDENILLSVRMRAVQALSYFQLRPIAKRSKTSWHTPTTSNTRSCSSRLSEHTRLSLPMRLQKPSSLFYLPTPISFDSSRLTA